MEVSFMEMLLVGTFAFLVLGPKEMIRFSQSAGRWIGKMRTEMNNFKIMAQEQILKTDELNSRLGIDGPRDKNIQPSDQSKDAKAPEAENA